MDCVLFNQKALFVMGFFFIFSIQLYSQQLTHVDSLASEYNSKSYKKNEQLSLLKQIIENYKDPDKKLQYSEELIRQARAADSTGYLFIGYQNKGNAFRLKGDLSTALDNYIKAAEIARPGGQTGTIYITIADVYSIIGNHGNAVDYYQKAITTLRNSRDSIRPMDMASALYNLGDEYIKVNKLDSALAITKQSQAIFSSIHSDLGSGYCLGNIGVIYSKLGNDKKAEDDLEQAIKVLQPLNEYGAICEFLTSIADIHLEKGDSKTALTFAKRSLEMAKQYGLKQEAGEAAQKLSEAYQKSGDFQNAMLYYKEYITYRDSVKNIESVEQMADVRTNFEVSKKQVEVDLLNQQKKNQRIMAIATAIALLLVAVLAIGLYKRYRFVNKTNKIIETERKRSDNLLLNILPEETAAELKQNGKVQPRKFKSVTVLFTDFKGFTSYAENLSPENVVATVDFYFSKFDEIVEKYGLEKIKTIGDSYMCAGGLPFATEDHAIKTTKAALEIAAFVSASKQSGSNGQMPFDIRIGINTGPVVAGVVGFKKFAYDIWGDTVNIASRMESTSEPGRINLSENTYALVKDAFNCEYRGEINVKNHGIMKMYFVEETLALALG